MVLWLTLWERPMSASDPRVPARKGFPALAVRQLRLATRHNAFGLRAAGPTAGRLRINSRSNSAKPPKSVSISLPYSRGRVGPGVEQ
jgi:hypothetical protein